MLEYKGLFEHLRPVPARLEAFGFKKGPDGWKYSVLVMEPDLEMQVLVQKDGNVQVKVMDLDTGEEYDRIFIRTPGSDFQLEITERCEENLKKIAAQCFVRDGFRQKQTRQLCEWITAEFGDELEFLWADTLGTAIIRRPDSRKWYAAFLTVSRDKIGLDGSEVVEVMNLKGTPEMVRELVDHVRYLPGYHMSKKTWYTVVMDDSVDSEELKGKIRISHELSGKGKKKK